jgi:hypothetical protein
MWPTLLPQRSRNPVGGGQVLRPQARRDNDISTVPNWFDGHPALQIAKFGAKSH